MRVGRLVFVLVLLICVFETARLWAAAPPEMASHFDLQGLPDRFSTRAQFFGFQIQTLMVVIGLAVLMQVFVLLTPLEWLHMPEREYWLAPERRAVTLDRLSSFAAMLFGVVLLGVQAGFELAAQANLHRPIEFNAPLMFAAIALCVVLSLGLLWGLMLSFRVPAPRV